MFSGKKILVVGLARSGMTAVRALHQQGAVITLNDTKTEAELETLLEGLSGLYEDHILGMQPTSIESYDCIVMSPGVPTDLPFILDAKAKGIPVIGELELGYRLAQGTFIGITGTNGKTTTTALVGEIFKNHTDNSFVVGNIGIPVVDKAGESNPESIFVTEISSFQLETIDTFRAHIAAILNITPDHLNRHKTMENYIDAKCRIFENQSASDWVILNADNTITKALSSRVKTSRVLYISRLEILEHGAYIQNGSVMVSLPDAGEPVEVMKVDDIFILGKHNLENVLAAVLIAYLGGVPADVIRTAVMSFKGVEHRIEYVGSKNDIAFYNDSKATNPDSAIKAVESMVKPTVIIAGGMDKGSEFDDFIQSFTTSIQHMIVFGETAALLLETAKRNHFEAVSRVNTLDEAVASAYAIAEAGWVVLLSPACASWDMYPSYEHRGDHFKKCFEALR